MDIKTTIPREAVNIMSGFSDEVAIAVTHPLWPSNEPRNLKDSDILLSVSWFIHARSLHHGHA